MESLRPYYNTSARSGRKIRLLHVAPNNPLEADSPIICRFSTASLNDNPSYEALSYTWGDPTKKKTISINNTIVGITQNLHDALEDLRLPDQERTLWIDAVCINQDDDKERTHQVSQMRYIYQEASTVIIYLGQAWQGRDTAFDFLEISRSDTKIHFSPTSTPHVTVNGMNVQSEELIEAITYLFDLPWWKRVWTVQEFVLAREIVFMCGDRQMPGIIAIEGVITILLHRSGCCQDVLANPTPWEALLRLQTLFHMRRHKDETTFLYALEISRYRQSLDTRDKVYGMLGLASSDWQDILEADYTKSTGDVYRDLVFAAIKKTDTLEFLHHCHGKRNPGLRLPTWVPDWTATVDTTSATFVDRVIGYTFFDASYQMKPNFTQHSHKIAIVKGAIFDSIQSAGSPKRDRHVTTEELRLEWLDLARSTKFNLDNPNMSQHEHSKAVEKEIDTAFWQTLCGELICEVVEEEGYFVWRRLIPEDKPKYERWQSWISTARRGLEIFDEDVQGIDYAHNIAVAERRFVVSKKGHMGLAPKTAVDGDVIAVLCGADAPFILRPSSGTSSDESNVCYEVVGDCYIHGIMDGEVFSKYGMSAEELRLI